VPSQPQDPEHGMLSAYLGSQRRHVLGILDGLDDEALTASVLPSGWTPLGLVQHLALDVERFWFSCVMAGDKDEIAQLDDIENAWVVPEGTSPSQVLDRYREETDRAVQVAGSMSLDQEPAWWPEFFGDWRMDNLREVMMHVFGETATHAGHLDAARELIDGRQWRVLT
jgi:uncharacterized damage-inducible protein DinB